MDKREKVLFQALIKNEDETERWKNYEKDHKTAIENLKMFQKKIDIDIMIPIGSKALIPGHLKHTNEVLVSHYGKLFSKCSAFQAIEICNHRIKISKERLNSLKIEKDMFQNKLEKPHIEGVGPGEGQREIIEQCNEDDLKLWRKKHRKSVREFKLKEKTDKNKPENSDDDSFKTLVELELLEELDQELDELNVENDETLEKLMSGEIKVNEKKRLSYFSENNMVVGRELEENFNSESKLQSNSDIYENSENLISPNSIDFTNNNSIQNCNDYQDQQNSDDDDTNSSIDIPKEIIDIENEIETLKKYQKIEYLKDMIKKYENQIDSILIKTDTELNEKLSKLEIRDYLYDHLEFLEDQITDSDDDDLNKTSSDKTVKQRSTKSKKISFAPDDETLLFDKNETVTDMLRSDKYQIKKDIILLDDIKLSTHTEHNSGVTGQKKNNTIIDRIENNIKFVHENQSQDDFNLIDKILNPRQGKTLTIKFQHSSKFGKNNIGSLNKNIQRPSDFYNILGKFYSQNLKIHKTKTQDIDFRKKEFSSLQSSSQKPQNTILKKDSTKYKKCLTNQDEKIESSDLEFNDKFDMLLSEVVEKEQNFSSPNEITQPEPLPQEKFIDSRAPKKRISQFKLSRSNKSLTFKNQDR